jgi:mRNA interferase RelE/StbE
MAYRLEYQPGVLRSLERFPRQVQKRIVERLESLRDNPRPPGSVKLAGEDAYRVRVGDYRIIYAIYDDRLVVLVIDIGHRGEVYRRR